MNDPSKIFLVITQFVGIHDFSICHHQDVVSPRITWAHKSASSEEGRLVSALFLGKRIFVWGHLAVGDPLSMNATWLLRVIVWQGKGFDK